jgi:predicted N-acetyltransferase YhbS
VPAQRGDHPAIYELLQAVFQGPTPADFQAQLDEPGYEPSDRLLVKHGKQVVAHLRLARQTIWLDGVRLLAVRFMELATLPPYRQRGLASALLAAGEQVARQQGARVALTRTLVRTLFARRGWVACGQPRYAIAPPRAVLAEMMAQERAAADPIAAYLRRHRPRRLVVRPLRRVELPILRQLYEKQLAGRCGWPVRSDAYWDWLVARSACDRVYVAAASTEPALGPHAADSLFGYAFVQRTRIVELVTAPETPDAARALVRRICLDQSEQGTWLVRCDAPADSPIHAWFRQAGGGPVSTPAWDEAVGMAKILDPLDFLTRCSPVWQQRAARRMGNRPWELCLELKETNATAFGDFPAPHVAKRFLLTSRAERPVALAQNGNCQHRITLLEDDLPPLLLGDLGAAGLQEAGRLSATSADAMHHAKVLFPRDLWWRPPLDELIA